jgi:hypothetical protein
MRIAVRSRTHCQAVCDNELPQDLPRTATTRLSPRIRNIKIQAQNMLATQVNPL